MYGCISQALQNMLPVKISCQSIVSALEVEEIEHLKYSGYLLRFVKITLECNGYECPATMRASIRCNIVKTPVESLLAFDEGVTHVTNQVFLVFNRFALATS